MPSQPEELASILRELVDLSRSPVKGGDSVLSEEVKPSGSSGDQAAVGEELNPIQGPESGTR